MKMKKQTILLVHNFYKIGGGEHTVFANEKQMLIDNGHSVLEYTRHNDEIRGIWSKLLIPMITVFNWRTYFEVKKIIITNKIDIVHCHNTFPLISPSVYYAANSCCVPVIQTIHNFRLLCPNGILYRDGEICEDCIRKTMFESIKHKCYRGSMIQTVVIVGMLQIHRFIGTFTKKVDRYIVLTEFNKEKFKSLIPISKMTTKPNFSLTECEMNSKEKKKGYFIFVGRLEKAKGISFVLDVWKRMLVNEKLVIIGDGPLADDVEQICRKCGHIDYLGPQSHEKTVEYIKNSNALVFASEMYEGFPMVILEAMSQGTAIIAPNVGNASRIVNDMLTGLHFKFRDEEDFVHKVKSMSDSSQYGFLGSNGRMVFERCYTSHKNYEMLLDVYKGVM